ncbi:MAG: DUF2070 family protein [Archaeoglobaceae archaeon]
MGRDKETVMNAENLYKKLFVLPGIQKTLAAFAISTIVLSILDFRNLIFIISLILTIFAARFLIALKFNLKRTLFLTTLISLLGFLSFLISGSFSGVFFLFLAVLYFCSEKGIISSAIISSIPFLILEPNSIPFLTISSLLFFLYTRYLDSTNFRLKEYIRSFIWFWLTNNPRFVESALKKDSKSFEGRIRCLSVGEIKLISTDFHPGPFRNIGGARLVNMLNFPDSVYLHSPTSHERDPVSEEDVVKIKNALKCGGEILKAKKPFKVDGKNFNIFCFPFDKIKLIFVSGKNRIDDFSINSSDFIVDCHNANSYGNLSFEEVKEIEELVKIAEKIDSEIVEIKSAFVKINAESESIVNYVSALLIECEEKFAIVVFDSNNVELEFRKLVEKRFEEIGFKAIVCSTDNHSKTGVRLKESYKPAGSCADDYKILDELIEKCKNLKLEKREFRYSESRVNVRVLGDTLKKLEKVLERSNAFIRLFLFLIAINFFIPLAKIIYL